MPPNGQQEREKSQPERSRFEAMFTCAPIGVVIADRDGQAVQVNPSFCAMMDQPAEELLGASLIETMTHGEDIATERTLFDSLVEGQRSSYQIEKRYVRSDRQIVWASVKAQARVGDDGAVAEVILMIEDITARRDAEQALRSSETKMRMLSDTVMDGLIMIDHQGCVRHWSRAAVQMFGYSVDEAIGRRMHMLVMPHDDVANAERGLAEFQHTGTGPIIGQNVQYLAQRRNGERFPAEISVSPIKVDGKWWAVGTVRDITLRQKTQDATQQAAQRAEEIAEQLKVALRESEEHRLTAEQLAIKAREADRAKTQFLTDMSHEIRTPMTAVLGYTDILLRGDIAPQEQWNFLQSIKTNGRALLDLINQILDQSKIEAGRMDAQTVRLAPWDLLQEVDTLMRPRIEAKGLAFDIKYLGPIPQVIQTDAMKLRQILVNLIGNAIKFTEQGEISLTTRCQENEQGKLMLAMTVSDTGIGISRDMLKRIFSPYQQDEAQNKQSKDASPGTGLGLSISRKLAELLGGDITVESQVGHGSHFTVTIDPGPLDDVRMVSAPTITRLENPAVDSHRPPSPQLTGKVIVAEDTVATAIMLEFLLKDMGLDVQIAETGRVCCDMVFDAASRGEKYDLIIMDIHMPEMDGYQATRILRQLNYDVPILAVTARAMPSDRERCARAGCDDYITKPIDLEYFTQRVKEFITSPQTANRLRQ